ncbi:MAG: nucleotidyltransferase [Planctomycetes bacterium]|nr:nucleotidyltransferase [Planctomycetota bacterium]
MPDRRPSVPDVFRKGVQLLEAQRVPFIVVGGLAAGLQGRPRVTEDVDFMITIPSHKVWGLAEAARKEGFDVEPHEAELHWLASGFVRLWLGPPKDRVALDLMACNSDFLREASWRAQHAVCMGHRVPIASPEDMMLFKLSAYRDKDVLDLQAIFLRHEEKLDREHLRKWAAWFARKNPCFEEMPARLDLLLARKPMPPGRPSQPWG